MNLQEIGKQQHEVNLLNGWEVFTPESLNDVSFVRAHITLIHSEVSEAAEAVRKKDFENFKEELADTVLRITSIAHGLELDYIRSDTWPDWKEAPEHIIKSDIPRLSLDEPKKLLDALSGVHRRVAEAGGAWLPIGGALSKALQSIAVIAFSLNIDMEAECLKKIEANRKRGHKHGGKTI